MPILKDYKNQVINKKNVFFLFIKMIIYYQIDNLIMFIYFILLRTFFE